jgi:hypothetical protein
MNTGFTKLPKSYAADVVGSRLFFEKKWEIRSPWAFREPWNIRMAENTDV